MSSRFLSNAVLAVLAGFVVVASQAFASGPVSWIGFALGIAALGIVMVAQLDRSRPFVQRGLDLVVGALGVWTIIASLVFNGRTVTWLSFAEALGFVAVALCGLTLREVQVWRSEKGLTQLHGERSQAPSAHETLAPAVPVAAKSEGLSAAA